MDGTNPPSPDADATRANLEEKINLENGVKGGGNWFYFIAAATAINTFSHVFLQADWTLFIGLGISLNLIMIILIIQNINLVIKEDILTALLILFLQEQRVVLIPISLQQEGWN